ncbi:MAG: endonuclease/exonuclease/phosphatase family protein [Bacteroidota bacterium]
MDQQLAVRLKYLVFSAAALILAHAFTGCTSSRYGAGQATFRVLTVNVQSDDSTDVRTNTRRLADMIREVNPDLVAVQGIRRSVVQSETFDVLTALSELTGMTYAFGETRADSIVRFGNGFLTRHPILEEGNTLYPAITPGKQNGLLRLLLDFGGNEIRVINTHLGGDAGEGEIAELKGLIRLNAAGAILLLGSSDKLSADEIAIPLMEILDDAWERAGAGSGFTFPANDPARRSDFALFTSGRPGFRAVAAQVLGTSTPTHLPLMVKFELVFN